MGPPPPRPGLPGERPTPSAEAPPRACGQPRAPRGRRIFLRGRDGSHSGGARGQSGGGCRVRTGSRPPGERLSHSRERGDAVYLPGGTRHASASPPRGRARGFWEGRVAAVLGNSTSCDTVGGAVIITRRGSVSGTLHLAEGGRTRHGMWLQGGRRRPSAGSRRPSGAWHRADGLCGCGRTGLCPDAPHHHPGSLLSPASAQCVLQGREGLRGSRTVSVLCAGDLRNFVCGRDLTADARTQVRGGEASGVDPVSMSETGQHTARTLDTPLPCTSAASLPGRVGHACHTRSGRGRVSGPRAVTPSAVPRGPAQPSGCFCTWTWEERRS